MKILITVCDSMFKINSLEELAKLSKEVKWQYFEKLVAWIFEQNDFKVGVNKVITFEGKRRQFDVIAERFRNLFLIECKKWSGKRYRTSQLKKAVKEHLEKCLLYKEKYNKEIMPLIVTLIEEDIKTYEGVHIVPIEKLNTFINRFDELR
jgi:hypothetical protein